MADKNIKRETKKPKKNDKKASAPAALRTVVTQPERIQKEKKIK